jgi:hypothetical protein
MIVHVRLLLVAYFKTDLSNEWVKMISGQFVWTWYVKVRPKLSNYFPVCCIGKAAVDLGFALLLVRRIVDQCKAHWSESLEGRCGH